MKLKRVCFCLSHRKWLEKLVQLMEKLQACGINCEVAPLEEEIACKEETLYLTDSASMARRINAAGLPVLVYLHEENREQVFQGIKYACEEAGDLEPEYLERVYRRFVGLPWFILETQRCILRESVEEDAEAFYQLYAEPSITRYMDDLKENPTSERDYLKEYRENMYDYYEFGIWTVILKETGEIIGRAGLSVREGYDVPELGYVIGVPWQGRGLAREVCQGILEYAGEEFGFEKVQALIHLENEASIALAVSLGFEEAKRNENKDENYLYLVRNRQKNS